jgi:uncharacterized heparinase superfamily protein
MTSGSLQENLSKYLRHAWRNSALYRFTLMSGPKPKYLAIIPTDPWPGDIYKGRQLLDGKFILANEIISMADLWMPTDASPIALKELHQFNWLRDLRALGDNMARRLARQLISNWIDRNQDWQMYSWQVGITGCRVANWIGLYDFFCSSADDSFRNLFFREISRQIRHLIYSWEDAPTSLERFWALKGIIFTAITFPGEAHRLEGLLSQLEKEVIEQILPDGGHQSRNPDIHVLVLRDLIDIRTMLRLIRYEIPPFIQSSINQMAPIVRLFRHGDGGLATFGKGSLISPAVIDMVLSLADVRGRPPDRAPHIGFERCANKSSLILLNVGAKLDNNPMVMEDEGTGSLNFEWSIGRDRFILQGDVILQTQEGKNIQIPKLFDAKSVKLRRTNQKGHSLVDVRYHLLGSCPFSHRRQLCLGGNNVNLRGEDTIEASCDVVYGIRFVLGKMVDASLSTGKRGVLLKLPINGKPSKTQEHQQWRLIASGIEEIVCEPHGDNKAILLLGRTKVNQQTSIQWAFCQD